MIKTAHSERHAMHTNPFLLSVPGERDMSRDNYRVFRPRIVLVGLTSQLPDRRNGYFWLALSSVTPISVSKVQVQALAQAAAVQT